MKKGRKFLSALVITASTVYLLWLCLLVQFTIPTESDAPILYAGDRVLVSRVSYGWRPQIPFGFGTPCVGYESPERGQWMAFRNPAGSTLDPDDRGVMVGQCRALPGDTVWVSWDGMVLDHTSRTNKAYPFVVPGRKIRVEVKPWNAALLCRTLTKHEHRSAVSAGDTAIILEGKHRKMITFGKDYFWIGSHNSRSDSDTRYFGFLPDDHLVGRVLGISFSMDPQAPFYASFRGARFFKTITNPSSQ